MNRKQLVVLAGLTLFAGCATSTMKSTPFYTGSDTIFIGKPEDRVNLWPIGYYREPALSVLWPVYSQTDDHLALRPLYSQYRQGGADEPYDEFNLLWPLCQFDTRHQRYRAFPAFWGESEFDLFPLIWWKEDDYFNVFPLFWHDRHNTALLPLFCSSPSRLYLFPSFYRDQDFTTFFPFYGRDTSCGELTEWFGPAGYHRGKKDSAWCFPLFYHSDTELVTPLFGYDREDASSWALPLFYRDADTFVSLPWFSQTENGVRSWAIPPLLTFGSSDERGWTRSVLLGLGGASGGTDGSFEQWCMPLFYRDNERFITALFGKTKDADWLVPLWYRSKDVFLSLPWCTSGDEHFLPPLLTYFNNRGDFASLLFGKAGKENWLLPLWWKDEQKFSSLLYCKDFSSGTVVLPPLLSWVDADEDDFEGRFLLGLCGYDRSDHRWYKSWLFPLFYADHDTFASLPFIHVSDEVTALALVVGIGHNERQSMGWLWPLVGWCHDRNMAKAEAQLNAERLSPEIESVRRQNDYRGQTNVWHVAKGGLDASAESWRLSGLSTSDRRISWQATENTVTGTDTFDFGNVFAFKRTSERKVTFDAKTRAKLADAEEAETGICCNLLWHSKHEADRNGHAYEMKSILWRCWHYENLDGKVSVDSIPFFTYDSKPNGYSKTSLCWRLFRNEYDPEQRRKLDLCFIPIWR